MTSMDDDGNGRYTRLENIGTGVYAKVYKALDQQRRQFVVVKVMRDQLSVSPELLKYHLREVSVLQRIKGHPNCCTLVDVIGGSRLKLVIEHAGEQNLQSFIKRRMKTVGYTLTTDETRMVARDLLRALDHTHTNGIIHRDVKPENVVLATNTFSTDVPSDFRIADLAQSPFPEGLDNGIARATLTDFGSARFHMMDWTGPKDFTPNRCVTMPFRPLEVFLGNEHTPYSHAVDLWSLGCLIAEIVCGDHLFAPHQDDSTYGCETGIIFEIFRVLGTPAQFSGGDPLVTGSRSYHDSGAEASPWPEGTQLPYFQPMFPKYVGIGIEAALHDRRERVGLPPSDVDPALLDFISRLLVLDPAKRMSAKEGLAHPFLRPE